MTRNITVAVAILILALAFGVGAVMNRRATHDDSSRSTFDPRLVCANPNYRSIAPGMSQADVTAKLGNPQRSQDNPAYVKQSAVQWQAIQSQRDAIKAKIGPSLENTNMAVLKTDPAVNADFNEMINLSTRLNGQTRTTWYYDTLAGWNGSVEIRFDDQGKVIGTTCGYG